jgi:hypothetical protein
MKLKKYIPLILIALILILFALFSQKIGFHDSSEYITFAKNFAGIKNVDLFNTHSIVYPALISVFLKIWPSATMLKLVNVGWIFLISLVLFFWLKDKRAFLLFAFSPLTWFVSIQTTPVLPASFFFLVAYLFLKKEHIRYRLFYSGFFLGLAYAFYDPMIFLIAIFVLTYFWDKKFYLVFSYLIFLFIGVLPRLILDYAVFNMPFYSIIRFFGTNMIISLGLYEGASTLHILNNLSALLIIFIISPFLFRLYKLKFAENKKDVVFLAISGILLLVRTAGFKYFLLIAPILLIYLAKVLSKREIKWHCIISIFIIIWLAAGFFTYTHEIDIQKDLAEITSEFEEIDYLVTGTYEAGYLASLSWEKEPYFAWYEDFKAKADNQTHLTGYDFGFDSDLALRDQLIISANFKRTNNRTYENSIFVSQRGMIPELTKDKCYTVLCTYK